MVLTLLQRVCTYFSQVLVGTERKNLKLVLKLGREFKSIPHKYGHICERFF